MLKCTPVHDRVVVKPDDRNTKTSSGLIVLEDAFDQPDQGTVVAIGEGSRTKTGTLIPLTLKVNNRVMYSKGTGQKVKIEGVAYLIFKEGEILATLGE